jgi:hypothetical protein
MYDIPVFEFSGTKKWKKLSGFKSAFLFGGNKNVIWGVRIAIIFLSQVGSLD